MGFKKAERFQAKLKLAITGPSGSGKTYSALLLAAGLGKKIAMIDTENGSGSLYAGHKGIPDYDVLEIKAPYTVQKYREAIRDAVAGKYDVLVIDSLTHSWAGEGGLLEEKELLDKAGKGNSYTNWATITKKHEQFKSDILNADVHTICTIRSKQDYILVESDKGKQVPRKVGMAPVQRDGLEYEFTVVFDLSMNHSAESSKDRTGLFDGKVFIPSVETGKDILAWLNGASQKPATTKPLTPITPRPVPLPDPDPDPIAANGRPGDSVVEFGPFKGKTIEQAGVLDVLKYTDGLIDESKKKGSIPNRKVVELNRLAANLVSGSNRPNETPPPGRL